jgi:HTH-type transcriptional regulator / antitoxin HigA
MKYQIKSKKAYHECMVEIYTLMNKGEANLNASELKKIAEMSAAAESYEDTVLGLQFRQEPESIPAMVELKLFEKKMTQAKLAEALGLSKSKVSEILNGKRRPDLAFLKGLYQVLKIDPEFLLKHA